MTDSPPRPDPRDDPGHESPEPKDYPYRLGRVTMAARLYLLTGTPEHRAELVGLLNQEIERGPRLVSRPSEAELLTALRRTLASAVELHELLECRECPTDHEDTGADCPVLVHAEDVIRRAEGRP